jgi:hypothetical protein
VAPIANGSDYNWPAFLGLVFDLGVSTSSTSLPELLIWLDKRLKLEMLSEIFKTNDGLIASRRRSENQNLIVGKTTSIELPSLLP